MRKKVLTLFAITLLLPVVAHARKTTLSGGISAGYDGTERSYDVNSDDDGEADNTGGRDDDETSRLVISPLLMIVTESVYDTLSLEYEPSFLYDLDESDNDMDHRLALDYNRAITRKWNFRLSDSYIDTDQFNSYSTPEGFFDEPEGGQVVTTTTQGEDSLRDESGRRRYYTNNFIVSTDYTYLEDSVLSLSYGWNVLRNEETSANENYEDYDKHDLYLSAEHQIDSRWRITGYAQYILGDYENPDDTVAGETAVDSVATDSEDLQEYHAGISLAAEFKQHHPITLSYDFSETDYDAEDVDNSQIHEMNLGYQWLATPRMDVSLGVGPTYTKLSDDQDSWDTNGYFNLLYRLEQGSLVFAVTGGTEFENFTGTDDRGVSQYWQARIDYTRTLLKDLSLSLYGYYRDENRDELSGTTVEETTDLEVSETAVQQLATGVTLSYTFYEDYTASFNYGYVDQSSDDPEDEYDEHRVQLTLTYQNDFMQW